MELELFNQKGEKAGKIKVSDHIFGIPVNEAVVHQALVMQLANRRQGTADTQTRHDVSRSSRKVYQQKHTGRARRGGATSPLVKGGAVVFGPHPRSYRLEMPKKMRRLALRSVLSGKVRDGELRVLDKLELAEGKTRLLSEILDALEIHDTAIIGMSAGNDQVRLAASNMPGVKATRVSFLNVADLLAHKILVLDKDAVRKIEELWDEKKPAGAKAKST